MTNRVPTIVFTGGGTLGHLFAGLAVADAVREIEPQARIAFAGRGAPVERQQVEKSGYDYHSVPSHPWPRRPWTTARFFAANLRGFFNGRRLLQDFCPEVVVGLGGYSSAPVGRAAISLRLPLVLLEQNAVVGRVNRWLSRHAAALCTSFEPASAARSCRMYHTGNPVRDSFLKHRLRCPREKLLLITGGSLGAAALNVAVPGALAKVKPLVQDWRIIHQAGQRDAAATNERYRQLGLTAKVTAFADMVSLLPRAGLAVCRAGGSTIAELQVTGTPALLCPYPQASDDHQRRNAAVLGSACRVIDESSSDFAGRLSRELTALLTDAGLRAEMSQAMLRQSRPDAARQVAQIVLGATGGWPSQAVPLARGWRDVVLPHGDQ